MWLAAATALFGPQPAEGQRAGDVVLGAGGGGTYYCIVSRCDSGATLVALAGWAPRSFLVVEGSGRWHECFDCDRFVVAEASLKLRRPGGTWHPFVGVGIGVTSDPGFMGTGPAPHAAVGAWMWPSAAWGLQAEVRGRRLGRGDAMGEASLAVVRRLRARPGTVP